VGDGDPGGETVDAGEGDPGGVEENSRQVAASEIRATPEGSKRIAGRSRRAR
jgi:hypothetical protein